MNSLFFLIFGIIIAAIIYIYIKFNKQITAQLDINTTLTQKAAFLSKKIDDLVTSDSTFVTQLTDYDILPIGTILTYTSPNIDNPKYMMCDGSQLFIAENTDLFKIIGTTYNSPNIDADLYFNIPDLRGVFLRGNDNDRGVDLNRELGTLQDWSTANARTPFTTASAGGHTHQYLYKYGSVDANADAWPANNNDVAQTLQNTTSAGEHIHTIVGGDKETRPVNLTVNYIIKVKK